MKPWECLDWDVWGEMMAVVGGNWGKEREAWREERDVRMGRWGGEMEAEGKDRKRG